jgi:hypothetical protein
MGSAQPGSFQAGLECHCGSSTGTVILRDAMMDDRRERTRVRLLDGKGIGLVRLPMHESLQTLGVS